MKHIRYGSPSGNIWVSTVDDSIGIALDKNTAIKNAENKNEAIRKNNIVNKIVSEYVNQSKQPMLIVGASNWMREHIPFAVLQQFDVHLFFYPNSLNAWVCGAVAINRINPNAAPVWNYTGGNEIKDTLQQTLWGLIPKTLNVPEVQECHPKLLIWTQLWAYRCPKISMKDVLSLDPYDLPTFQAIHLNEQVEAIKIFRKIIGDKQ